MALSELWLKSNNLKIRDKITVKTDRDGLSVRVTPKGKIIYQLRYRYDGKASRCDLGSYPQVTLKDARAENLRLKARLDLGYDPKVVRQLEKRSIITASKFESLFRQWYESYCVKNKKGHVEILRSFELYVFPKIGNLPAKDVNLQQWLPLFEKLAEITPSIAERLLINTKQMYKWAVKRQYIESNPLTEINAHEDLQIKKIAGQRSLSDEEIKMVWFAINKSRMSIKNKIFVKLCLLYGCRNGELRKSERGHFDFEKRIWTIPPENHKAGKLSGKPLLRPITEQVVLMLNEVFLHSDRKTKYIFTNAGTNNVMGRSAPVALPYNIMQFLRKNKDYEMAHWSIHDLRKTARTNFSQLTQPHIAEIMLGHKLPGQWLVYDHYDYIKEQAETLTKWWEKLMLITEGM